jgi:F0F1-type ATP synthase membrane subunit c/vacuolar-type H+-ATPase subunit K
MQKFYALLKQPSTYRGIVAACGVIGWSVSPEQWEGILAMVVLFMGMIEVFRDEDTKK